MATQGTWLWIGGVTAVATVALALGMPLGMLLLFAILLICPLAMYFMMGRMGGQRESDHAEMGRRSEMRDA